MQLRSRRRRRRFSAELVLAALLPATALAACGNSKDSTQDQHLPQKLAAPDQGADAASAKPKTPEYRSFASAGQAVASLLAETKPRVIGFGEHHELAGARVRSAISRFHSSIVPRIAARTSDLILEFWARDACGEKSEKVNKDVQRVTQRPVSTGNEVIALLTETKRRGITNHVLPLSCPDYDSIVDAKGEVDYEKLLVLVTQKLFSQADKAMAARADQPAKGSGRGLVILYGGALHNNLYPPEGTDDLSYAKRMKTRAQGAFIEIDLIVPEYVSNDKLAQSEAWYRVLQERASPDVVWLVERKPGSYVLILRAGLVKKSP